MNKSGRNLMIAILVLSLATTLAFSNYSPQHNVNLIPNISYTGYSPDHSLLVAIQKDTNGKIFSFNGKTYHFLQNIDIETTNDPSTFAFSSDSSLLAIGTFQGNVYWFTVSNGVVKEPWAYKVSVTATQTIYTLAFNSKNQLAVGIKNQAVVYDNKATEKARHTVAGINQLQSLQWSTKTQGILLAGGIGATPFFGILKVDQTTATMTEINSGDTVRQTQSVQFSADQTMAFQGNVGDNIQHWAYDPATSKLSAPTPLDGTNTMNAKHLKLTGNGANLAAVIGASHVTVWSLTTAVGGEKLNLVQQQNQNPDNELKALTATIILGPAPGIAAAFASDSNDVLIVVDATNIVNRFATCAVGNYFDGTQCQDCKTSQSKCLECYDQNICYTCQTGTYFDSNTNSCPTCDSKTPGCEACDSTTGVCSACDADKGWVGPDAGICKCGTNKKPDGNVCVCNDKYYPDPADQKNCLQCDPVHQNCLKCNSPTECSVCDPEKFWAQTQPLQGQCTLCKTTYWNNNKNCDLCTKINGCTEDCTNDGKCEKCDQNKGFNPQPDVTGKCGCKTGFYTDINKCTDCKISVPGCAACTAAKQCTACGANFNPSTDPTTCTCPVNTAYQPDPDTCTLCSARNCATCTYTAPNVVCQTCLDGFFHSADNKCLTCEQTITGCSECTNKDTCKTCNKGKFFVDDGNGKCKCDPNHFIQGTVCTPCNDAKDGILYCVQCTIDQTSKKCSKCEDNFPLQNDVCTVCHDDIPGCLLCQSSKICKNCDQNAYNPTPDTDTGKCLCNGQSYKDPVVVGGCKRCDVDIPGCTSCDDGAKCTTCNKAGNFIPDGDKCQCDAHHFLNKGECAGCSTKTKYCDTCDNKAGTCNDCLKPFTLNPDTNTCLSCQQADAKCAQCTDMTICKTCKPNMNYDVKPNGSCGCISTYYEKVVGQACELCFDDYYGCETCNKAQCLTCAEEKNFVKNADNINCECKQGAFDNKAKGCPLCADTYKYCKTCNVSQCLSCKDNFDLSEDKLSCACTNSDRELNNEGQCVQKSGLSALAIIAIIVGILALAGAAVAIIKCCKKKKSPLEDDQYEAIEGQK